MAANTSYLILLSEDDVHYALASYAAGKLKVEPGNYSSEIHTVAGETRVQLIRKGPMKNDRTTPCIKFLADA